MLKYIPTYLARTYYARNMNTCGCNTTKMYVGMYTTNIVTVCAMYLDDASIETSTRIHSIYIGKGS